jgi:toxin-antitoxin system PIN domain toxin
VKLLDVNVVLAASRDDHPHFEVARPYLDRLLAAGDRFSITDLVAGAFLRLATNRRIFLTPTPIEQAFGYLRALRAQPAHLLLGPGPAHLELLERIATTAEALGDLMPDAQLAAVAVEHACEIVSFDRDFARFSEVHWSLPS